MTVPGRLTAKDTGLLVLVAVAWGLNFVPIRWALNDLPPFMLAAVRFFLAAVPLMFFVKRPNLPWRYVVGYGLAIGAGQFGLLFLAIRLGFPAGLASLLIQVQVFFTIFLSAVFARDRPRLRHLVGACIAALGIVALVAQRLKSGGGGSGLGLLVVLASAISWAVGNVTSKVAGQRYAFDMFALVVWSSLAAPLPLLAMSYGFEGGFNAWHALASASPLTWGSVFFITYAGTIFGYAVWNRMLLRHSAGQVTPFALLVPIVGLASAAAFLGEPLELVQALAAAVVLAGLAVAVLGRRGTRTPVPT
ncbi:MAG: EamA family transporter [bacterium]